MHHLARLLTIVPALALLGPLQTTFQARAETKLELAIDCPRRAVYRGETVQVVVRCKNLSSEPLPDARVAVDAGGVLTLSQDTCSIGPGERWSGTFRIPTQAIRTGEYELIATVTSAAGDAVTATGPLTVGRRPNPNRLMVWLWGGGGGAWYMQHGFTSWYGAGWQQATTERAGATRRALDAALPYGGDVSIFPNGGLRDLADQTLEDPDAWYLGLTGSYLKRLAAGKVQRIPNPFHPEVARIQDQANRRLMRLVRDYPQVRTAFFNSEVVDNLALNRNQAGLRRMRERLGFAPEDVGEPKLVAPGVIADDDRAYRLRKYAYQHGKGVAEANRQTAEIVHAYRPDILTISDPYREAALLDLFPGLDVIETWTYTNPDPKLMLYVETLRAACKPTGQIPLNVVTMLNYPGQLDPTDQWLLMGPGRATVTSWINLSRAPKMVGYYYSSECPPIDTDSYKVPQATSRAIQELAERVYQPYGPMLTRLQVGPRRIAVLSSESARTHGKSPRLLGGYANLQIYHFYTVLAMAHLQADVVFDETIERFGLAAYDVLVLPKCDVLTERVYNEIRRFQDRGGLIIADQYLGADIPGTVRFDFDFTYRSRVSAKAIAQNVAYAEWNDQLEPDSAQLKTVKGVTALDDQRIMESYAARLKEKLRGQVDPAVDCDAPTVLLNMLEREGVKYLVVINDRRTYDERVGKYKGVLGKLLPQTATIVLDSSDTPNLVVYDMLRRQALKLDEVDGMSRFTVELNELGGTIVALYPSAMGPMRIEAPPAMTAGIPAPVRIAWDDVSGNPLPGLQPVEVAIVSPSGQKSDFSDYYCAERGTLTLDFVPALNDESGRWRITATDLTSGQVAEQEFELEPAH